MDRAWVRGYREKFNCKNSEMANLFNPRNFQYNNYAAAPQVDVLLPSGEVVHFINYTVIPIDSSSCLGNPPPPSIVYLQLRLLCHTCFTSLIHFLILPSAETTCEAMQGITDYLNVETNPDESRDTCTLSKNCLLIACSDNLNWTLVPCSNPPGLTLAWKEGVSNVHTHTFVHTEVVNISNLGQPRTIHVRLDQLQTAIGLQARRFGMPLQSIVYIV